MKNIYAKLEGQIGRLAINLHAIEEVEENSPNDFLKLEPLPNQHSGSSRNESKSSRNGLRNDFLNIEPLASEHSGSSRNERNDLKNHSKNIRDGQATEKNESKNIPEIITPLCSLREVPQPFVESGIEPRNGSRNAPPQTITRTILKPELESDLSLETQNQNLECDTPVIASSVKSTNAVSKPKKVGLGEWKKGDTANHCGYEVSIYRIDKEDGSIMIRRQDGELINAQKCELFRPVKRGDKAAITATIRSDAALVEVENDSSASLLQIEKDGGDIARFVGHLIEVRSLSGAVKFTGEMTDYNEKNGFITVMTEEGNRDVSRTYALTEAIKYEYGFSDI